MVLNSVKGSIDEGYYSDVSVKENIILQEAKCLKLHGQVVGSIASSYYYANVSISIIDLANTLNLIPGIDAIGVVDDDGVTVGLLKRKELFDRLGHQFGRAVYSNQAIGKMIISVKRYNQNRSIFSVAEDLKTELRDSKTLYFLITKDNQQFAGIFSTKDLLIYLSFITQNDIALARNIQHQIVYEEKVMSRSNVNIVGASSMAKGVGGDFYSINEFQGKEIVVAFCDVSGKGISASLVSAMLGGMFAVYDFSQGIEKLIMDINEYMIATFSYDKFLTGVFFSYDESNDSLVLYDMGHSYLYLIRNDKFFHVNNTGDNLPLGISEELSLKSKKINLEVGDVFVVLTDGIIEQINEQGQEFGEIRLTKFFKQHRGKDLKIIKDLLYGNL